MFFPMLHFIQSLESVFDAQSCGKLVIRLGEDS